MGEGGRHPVALLVEALRYKPEGRKLDSPWYYRDFLVTESFMPHFGPGVDSASKRNGGKGGWWVGLTTVPSSCDDYLEIWGPQPPGTLRGCPGLYRDCFVFTRYGKVARNYKHIIK